MADQVSDALEVPREFVKDGVQFMTRCQKPDQKEFLKISQAVGVGFLIMGFVGYIVKLIHIPLKEMPAFVGFVSCGSQELKVSEEMGWLNGPALRMTAMDKITNREFSSNILVGGA